MTLHEPRLLGPLNCGNLNMKEASYHNFEVNEKRSSNASLLLMNPVASGDNVTTGLSSAHKLKDETPSLVPCCEGKELQINEDLVRTGLSAISVRHDNVLHSLSLSVACERLQVTPGLVKHRNSFRSLHRPDLKRVPYLRRMRPDELETLFKGYADFPSKASKDDNIQDSPRAGLPSNEDMRSHKEKEAVNSEEGVLHPILETRSGAEDVPEGKRLHGARARLYTSVLAGAKAGDQLDAISINEDYDKQVPQDDPLGDDEDQINEELQIILPPRSEDIVTESHNTAPSEYRNVSSLN